jgi:hypothetical protein
MANLFFTGGKGGFSAINIDQIRVVNWDAASNNVIIYFQPDHTIELKGQTAMEFIDTLKHLKSEASLAVGTARAKAVKGAPKKPKPTG